MTREQAQAEAQHRQRQEPGSTFTLLAQDGAWVVVRIGVAARGPASGTATKPPPVVPQAGPPGREVRATLWGATG